MNAAPNSPDRSPPAWIVEEHPDMAAPGSRPTCTYTPALFLAKIAEL
jgi:hypothetical protein